MFKVFFLLKFDIGWSQYLYAGRKSGLECTRSRFPFFVYRSGYIGIIIRVSLIRMIIPFIKDKGSAPKALPVLLQSLLSLYRVYIR